MLRHVFPIAGAVALALSFASPLPAFQQDTIGAEAVIVLDSLDRAAFANVAELLQARVPGLHITRTGDGAMQWFMRGPSSATGSMPMVLIDGARMTVAGSGMTDMGTRPPLLDDIDLEEVDRIEVWNGTASAIMQGTGAGNGVINVVTVAPRAQKTSFRMAASGSRLDDATAYPANAVRAGVDTSGQPVRRCTLRLQADELCTPTGPVMYINPLETGSPFETALAARVAVAIASGNERLAWQTGASVDRQGSTTGTLAAQRLHVRGSATFRANRDAEATLRAHWMRGDSDLPAPNEQSELLQGLFARPDTVWRGFVEPPTSPYTSRRYGIALNGRWHARNWLEARLTSGIERLVDENDLEYVRDRGPFALLDIDIRGERRYRDLTARLNVEARYGARSLRQATVLTLERVVSRQEEEFSERYRFEPGSATERAWWMNYRTGIAGVGMTQHLRVADAVTVTGGLRLDQARLGDLRWDVPPSPHVSATWDVRPFVPAAVGGVRLRAALGDVANLPQTTRIFFLPRAGEPERPKAEVTRERAVGLDARFAHERVGVSVDWYTKRTSNVRTAMEVFQPSLAGFPGFQRIEVLNRGIETAVRARVIQRGRFTWDVRGSYAYNHNEVRRAPQRGRIDLGEPALFAGQWLMQGQPLGAYRTLPIESVRDLDGDGLVDDICYGTPGCEVLVGTSAVFRPAFPPTSATLETSVRFGSLTFSMLADHRGGHALSNLTLESRCFLSLCPALYDPSTSVREQTEAILASGLTGSTVQDASFTKLREVSLRIEAPMSWARALGASWMTVALAGRNVATWTHYGGLDPESTSRSWIPLSGIDYGSMPLPRRFVLRVDLQTP